MSLINHVGFTPSSLYNSTHHFQKVLSNGKLLCSRCMASVLVWELVFPSWHQLLHFSLYIASLICFSSTQTLVGSWLQSLSLPPSLHLNSIQSSLSRVLSLMPNPTQTRWLMHLGLLCPTKLFSGNVRKLKKIYIITQREHPRNDYFIFKFLQ